MKRMRTLWINPYDDDGEGKLMERSVDESQTVIPKRKQVLYDLESQQE